MSLIGLFAVTLYVIVALFALYMTHQERRWNAQVTPLYGALGYALCVVWPLMVAFMLVTTLFQRLRPDTKVVGKTG